MEGHAQQSNADPSESHFQTTSQASAAEQLLALSCTTTRTPAMHHPPQIQSAVPSSESSTFLASLTAHYATRSDTVTPHIFAQHCKDYHTGQSDENSFYVSVCRLLCATEALHLIHGFKAFLPSAWRNIELNWLDRAVEEDVQIQAKESRERTATLMAMMKGFDSTQIDASLPSDNDDTIPKRRLPGDDSEALAQNPAIKKRKTPINAFRSTPKVSSLLAESSTTSSPESNPAPAKKALKWLSAQNNRTLTPASAKTTRTTATPLSAKPTALPSTLPTSLNPTPALKLKPTPSSILPSASPANTPIPPASSIPHLGPIYRDKRTIFSRSTKPYIHALCGQHFGHPNEVLRHHNGQGGRPGCWEKKGKPKDEEGGAWDEHASCKVRLTDITFVKVKEGFVVTSWGSVRGLEGLREGEDVGPISGRGVTASGDGGEKRKTMVKLNFTKHLNRETGGGENGGSNGGKGAEDGGLAEFVDAQSSPEPLVENTQMTGDTTGDHTAVPSKMEVNAAARAVAFGLRTRK